MACPQSRHLLGDTTLTPPCLVDIEEGMAQGVWSSRELDTSLVYLDLPCPARRADVGPGMDGRPCLSRQLCFSFRAWSLLTKTQHDWLLFPKGRPLALGCQVGPAWWDELCGTAQLAVGPG